MSNSQKQLSRLGFVVLLVLAATAFASCGKSSTGAPPKAKVSLRVTNG